MSAITRSVHSAAHGPTRDTVVVLLHGYGSTEHDLAGLMTALGLAATWDSPRAPLEMGTGGAAWFHVVTPGDPEEHPVVEATSAIWDWIDARYGNHVNVVPVGFSQGGLMATQLLRTRPDRVAATVVLGGFTLAAPQPADERLALERPAVFWGRGTDDRVISSAAIERTSTFLPGHSTLTERVYQGLAHGIGTAEVHDVRRFLTTGSGAPLSGTTQPGVAPRA